MPKPIVLIIHGMGTHTPGNTPKEFTAGINETAKHLGLENFNFSDQVELIEFNYSTFLDEIRLRDAQHASAIINHLGVLKGKGLGESVVTELTEFFAKADEDKFFNTHWLDVVYYGLMNWGEKIRVDLAKTINDLYVKKLATGQEVHIVAHSLGTAVLHDTLAKLYRKDPDLRSHAPQLDVDSFQVDSIFMFANVSRLLNLLNDIADPNKSVVMSGPGGCTRLFYNLFNEFDPFTWFKRFKRPVEDGQHARIKTVRTVNTHDLTEYAAAPPSTYLLLNTLLNKTISSSAYNTAVEKHGETTINATYEDLVKSVADLKAQPSAVGKIKSLEQLIDNVHEFAKRMEKMADSN